MTIRSGDVLTVVRQDIGEGWWEGTDQHGNTGLFPAAYVEVNSLPSQVPAVIDKNDHGNVPVQAVDSLDYWDDEWDDDSDGAAPPSTVTEASHTNKPAIHSICSVEEPVAGAGKKAFQIIILFVTFFKRGDFQANELRQSKLKQSTNQHLRSLEVIAILLVPFS